MNTLTHSPKKPLSFPLLIGMGMLLLTPGISLSGQSHEEIKADMAKAAQITIEQAVETARKEVPGTVIKAELEKEHGPIMWEIEILTSAGNVQEIHIDGANGKRLALKKGGQSQDADAAIHAGSADADTPKMAKPESDMAKSEEPSHEKKP